MKTITLLFIFLLSLPALLLGQNKKIDSLQKIIATTKIDTVKGRTLCRLCAILESIGEYETGMKKGEEGLAISEKKKDQKGVATCLNNIGIIYKNQGNYPKALEYYQKSLQITELFENRSRVANILNNIGIIYKNQGNYPKAIEFYQRSLKIREQAGNPKDIANSLNNIGNVYKNQGNYPKALECYQKCIRISANIGDSIATGYCLVNIGQIYYYQNNHSKALENYQKSLNIFEKINDQQAMANCLSNIGLIYQDYHDYPKALEYHLKSQKIYEQIGHQEGIANSLTNIGSIHTFQGNHSQAVEYYRKSLTIWEQVGDTASISNTLSNMGLSYTQMKQPQIAKEYASKGLELALKINNFERIEWSAIVLHQVDSALGDYKSSLEHHKLYKRYADSLNNEDKAQELGRLESQYEYEKRTEAKNKELALQAERRTQYYYLFGGVFALVLVGTGFIFYQYRTKEKNNRLLASKNELITTQKAELENAYEELNATMEQVKHQSEDIQHKNHQIEDSIRYAFQIQTAILPDPDYLQAVLPPHFIFYQPKDIVSGDFYQCYQANGLLYIIVADCTGHGVPGAFMSVVGNNALYNAIHVLQLTDPNVILSELDRSIRQTLKQESDSESKDGMDLGIIVFSDSKCWFAGAERPLYFMRNSILTEIKGDKFPIGGSQYDHKTFTTHEITTQKGDRFYLFTDGITDQFGGDHKKKFTPKRLQEFISEHQNDSLPEQGRLFTQIMSNWMKDQKQLDDLTLIGIEV